VVTNAWQVEGDRRRRMSCRQGGVASAGRSAPEGEIVIARPAEEVFDVVADERHVYDPRVVRVETLSPGRILKRALEGLAPDRRAEIAWPR
jgi:hypothetical protein